MHHGWRDTRWENFHNLIIFLFSTIRWVITFFCCCLFLSPKWGVDFWDGRDDIPIQGPRWAQEECGKMSKLFGHITVSWYRMFGILQQKTLSHIHTLFLLIGLCKNSLNFISPDPAWKCVVVTVVLRRYLLVETHFARKLKWQPKQDVSAAEMSNFSHTYTHAIDFWFKFSCLLMHSISALSGRVWQHLKQSTLGQGDELMSI